MSQIVAPPSSVGFSLPGVTGFGGAGNSRRVVVAPDGSWYMLLSLSAGLYLSNTSLIVYRSVTYGQTWTQITTPLSPSGLTSLGTIALAVNGNGLIGVAYIAVDATYPNCSNIVFSLWTGSSWNAYQNISAQNTSGYTAASASLKVDASNVWYCAWTQKDSGSTTSARVQYSTRSANSGGTWAATTNVGAANSNATGNLFLLLDTNGYPHIVCQAGASSYHAHYTNAGGSWALTQDAVNVNTGSVVRDSANTLYLSSFTTSTIYTCTVSGTWSTLAAPTLFPSATTVTLSIDGADTIYAHGGATPVVQKYASGAWNATPQIVVCPSSPSVYALEAAQTFPRILLVSQAAGYCNPIALT